MFSRTDDKIHKFTAENARTLAGQKYLPELDRVLQDIKTAAESGKFYLKISLLSEFVEQELSTRGFATVQTPEFEKVISW